MSERYDGTLSRSKIRRPQGVATLVTPGDYFE